MIGAAPRFAATAEFLVFNSRTSTCLMGTTADLPTLTGPLYNAATHVL